MTQINQQLSQAGGFATASLTNDGRLTFTSAGTGTDAKLTIGGGSAANTIDVGFGIGTLTAVSATGIDATDGSGKATVTGAAVTALGTASNFDLTSGDASITGRIIESSVQKGWELREISLDKSSLDEIFAQLSNHTSKH